LFAGEHGERVAACLTKGGRVGSGCIWVREGIPGTEGERENIRRRNQQEIGGLTERGILEI